MDIEKKKPVYSIGVASELLGVTQETLRHYENAELIKPFRTKGGKRLYSQADIEWLFCLREIIKEGHSILSIQKLLKYEACYELKNCPDDVKANCQAIREKISKEKKK